MAKTIIPAGYRVTVTTWENDGDNYNTKMMEGLSSEEVRFIVKLCNLHKSKNGRRDTRNFGNMYETRGEELADYITALNALAEGYRKSWGWGIFEYFKDKDEDDKYSSGPFDAIRECIVYDLGLSGGEFTTRVFESIKIEYMPEPIEIEDVTDLFVED